MTWTRLDDRWDVNTKMVRAMARVGDAAPCVWARGVTLCNRDLTDGVIHGDVLRSLTRHKKPQEVVDALVSVGLLEEMGDDSYQFHDFLDWNDSRETVEARRVVKREAASKGGKASAESKQKGSKTQAPCLPPGAPMASQNGTTPELTPSPSPSPSPSGSTNQTEDSAPAAPSPASKPKPKDDVTPEEQAGRGEVLGAYRKGYLAARGVEPAKGDAGKNAALALRLVRKLGPADAVATVNAAFADNWHRTKVTLQDIVANPDKYRTAGGSLFSASTLPPGTHHAQRGLTAEQVFGEASRGPDPWDIPEAS